RNGQLFVAGQRLTYVGMRASFHTANDLSRLGAAPGVQGTIFYGSPQSEQPLLIVLRGARLTVRPGYVSVNGKPLEELYARQTPRRRGAPGGSRAPARRSPATNRAARFPGRLPGRACGGSPSPG